MRAIVGYDVQVIVSDFSVDWGTHTSDDKMVQIAESPNYI
jgi:hypothetical protein